MWNDAGWPPQTWHGLERQIPKQQVTDWPHTRWTLTLPLPELEVVRCEIGRQATRPVGAGAIAAARARRGARLATPDKENS